MVSTCQLMRHLGVILFAASAIVACNDATTSNSNATGGSSNGGNQGTNNPPSTIGPTACIPSGGSFPSGKSYWAVREITRNQPAFGSLQIATNHYIFEIVANDKKLAIREKLCDIQVHAEDKSTSVSITRAYANSMKIDSRAGSIESTGCFHFEKNAVQRGVTLADIDNDPLPTDPSDPRIGDWDNDGHPGVTLNLSGALSCKLFTIERDWSELDGTVNPNGTASGTINFSQQQIYLGAEPPGIEKLVPESKAKADGNVFDMVQLKGVFNIDDPSLSDQICDTVKAQTFAK